MKREFIKGLLPDIADDVLKQIMDEHSKDIGQYTTKVSTLETERDGLKTQLDEANKSIQSYKDMDIDGIKKSAADWQTKYNTETKALQDKLDAQAYGYAVEGIVAKEKFSSQAGKSPFYAETFFSIACISSGIGAVKSMSALVMGCRKARRKECSA
ncbi:MAG: phage scaffolding protein [Clostridiales bacterium]|nr:phage scaffolding protein [Clostridiales bacterium]